MTYTQKQVERGRRLVSSLHKATWDLGDLFVDVVTAHVDLSGLDYATSPEKSELEEFAADIGLPFKLVLRYRRVAIVFPKPTDTRKGRRDDVSWAVHEEFATADKPVQLLHRRKTWTVRDARDYLGKASKDGPSTPSRSGVFAGQGPVSQHERVQFAREALADDDVAREVMRHRPTRDSAVRAGAQASREEFEAVVRDNQLADPEEAVRSDAAAERARRTALTAEFKELVWHARRDLINASEDWGQIAQPHSDGFVEEIVRPLDDIINAAEALKGALRSGVSLDDVLTQIFTEGDNG
jgi:hypothetical protein